MNRRDYKGARMKLQINVLVFCFLLFVTQTMCMLPSPVQPQYQPQPPQPSPQQQPPPQQQQQQQAPQGNTGPNIAFNFPEFFDYFIKEFGTSALHVFQDKLLAKKKELGLVSHSLPGIPIPCGLAPAFPSSTVQYEDPNRQHGSIATYKCDLGFKGAETRVMCQSGTWQPSNMTITCATVYCGAPPVMPNADASYKMNSKYGDMATYSCRQGFQADDIAAPIRCLQDGSWTSPSFRCLNMMMPQNNMYPPTSGMQQGGMPGMGGGLNPQLMGAVTSALGNMAAGGTPGAPSGSNPMAMLANMASMMNMGGGASNAAGAGAGAGGGNMAAMMAAMMNPQSPMANMLTGTGAGNPGAMSPVLPPHLAQLSSMAPVIMSSLVGGAANPLAAAAGLPGAAGPAAAPLEPEKQREQTMMMLVMSNMMRNQEAQRQRALQQQQMLRQKRMMEYQRLMAQQKAKANTAAPEANANSGGEGGTGINLNSLLQNNNPGSTLAALQNIQKQLAALGQSSQQTAGTSSAAGSSIFGGSPASGSSTNNGVSADAFTG